MDISVIIPTYNQESRLKLVLQGLKKQTLSADCFEIVVVDDGSCDGTWDMLERSHIGNLIGLRHDVNLGRNRARNRGIKAARGELIVLLDGDALPAPDLLERYLNVYRQDGEKTVMCGVQNCLADLEFLRDPVGGELMELEIPSIIKDHISARKDEIVITPEMVERDFGSIRKRACRGGYPFPESAERQRQVIELMEQKQPRAVDWIGFIPHNGAIDRNLILDIDGFDEDIPFSEGWELAYRLKNEHGADMKMVQAETIHLYHYHPFDDPDINWNEGLMRYQAIEYMVRKHGDPRLRLLYFWFAGLWNDPFIPEEAVVEDLPRLDDLYRELSEDLWQEYQIIIAHHPLYSSLIDPEVSYEDCA